MSRQNQDYMRYLFQTRMPIGPLRDHALRGLPDTMYNYAEGEGQALEHLQSDSVALRGDLRPAVDSWAELRRLNRAFYEYWSGSVRAMANILDAKPTFPVKQGGGKVIRDGVADDGEQYHMRMFIADSLRPPGFEHLNTPGPLYAIREDQSTWTPRNRVGRNAARGSGNAARGGGNATERFAAGRVGTADESVVYADAYTRAHINGDDDAPWSEGNPNRRPEQAIAEYWGDDRVATGTTIGATEIGGASYGDLSAWGKAWGDNGGTRFERYPTIPFWQQGGREGYEYDIEETLGSMTREMGAQVRRWDMERLRAPRGQEYRRLGPRSGHVV